MKIILLPKDPNDDRNTFLKFVPVQEEMKPLFLLVISLGCTVDLPKKWVGGLRL